MQNSRILCGIVGFPGAGKSTATRRENTIEISSLLPTERKPLYDEDRVRSVVWAEVERRSDSDFLILDSMPRTLEQISFCLNMCRAFDYYFYLWHLPTQREICKQRACRRGDLKDEIWEERASHFEQFRDALRLPSYSAILHTRRYTVVTAYTIEEVLHACSAD